MSKTAKIFSPDEIKTQISQAVRRDMGLPPQGFGGHHGVFDSLQNRVGFEIDKKYTSIESLDDSLGVLAFIKFLNVNDHMRSYGKEGLDLPTAECKRPQTNNSVRDNILLRARAVCAQILGPFDEDLWFRYCKHGTGVSIGVPFGDTSLEAKSSFPISVTKNASSTLTRYLDFDFVLKSAMMQYCRNTPIGGWYNVVEGSRATTVPKSNTIDRMIAVEPTGNMFLQQGLMQFMYHRLRDYGVNVETLPTTHRERARTASITSQEATIDWSSASDCVSIELLRWLLPPAWFDCCDKVRSSKILIQDTWIDLAMFSTMGNAVTFPLETLVLYSLAIATFVERTGSLSHFPEWEDRHRCSVFGDDCIVPSCIASDFITIACSVGFIVNEQKTFIGDEGFRESCGGDFLRGYDNRPFHMKAPTSVRFSALEPWLYIIGNRLIAKYMMCFGTRNYIYDKEFLNVYFALFRDHGLKIKVVPPDFPDDAGLKISDDFDRIDVNFRPSWSRVAVNQHGVYRFLYTRYKYRGEEERRDDYLRYAVWLKTRAWQRAELDPGERISAKGYVRRYTFVSHLRKLEHLSVPLEPVVYRRRKVRGGYVVASGKTSRWDVQRHRISC